MWRDKLQYLLVGVGLASISHHFSLFFLLYYIVARDLQALNLPRGNNWILPFTLDPSLAANSAWWMPRPRRKFCQTWRSNTLEEILFRICLHARSLRKPDSLDPWVSRSRPIPMLDDSQRITFWLSLLCTETKIYCKWMNAAASYYTVDTFSLLLQHKQNKIVITSYPISGWEGESPKVSETKEVLASSFIVSIVQAE